MAADMTQASAGLANESHFTVLIRLPYNRGSFIDPPPVCLTFSIIWVQKLSEVARLLGRLRKNGNCGMLSQDRAPKEMKLTVSRCRLLGLRLDL